MVKIVPATERDIPLILSFIRKLAEYEKLSHQVVATEELLREGLFGARRAAEVVLAYLGPRSRLASRSSFTISPRSSAGREFISRIFLWSQHTAARESEKRCWPMSLTLAVERGCGALRMGGSRLEHPSHRFLQKLRRGPFRRLDASSASPAKRCRVAAGPSACQRLIPTATCNSDTASPRSECRCGRTDTP